MLVASAVDRHGVDGVIGTVAGDDTIFLATTSRSGARDLLSRLRRHRDRAA